MTVEEAAEKSVAIRVTGRVQGVAYRDSTRVEAERLGVRGWVRNDYDGSVTGHLEGAAEAVDALVEWCRSGPSAARVRDLAVREDAATGDPDFRIAW